MTAVENGIRSLVVKHRAGSQVGITSVCSANEFVIKAAMLDAMRHECKVLIESTSNQVDQFGGYTGMTPDKFRRYVCDIAGSIGFSTDSVLLGGDHLGPNVWQVKPAFH